MLDLQSNEIRFALVNSTAAAVLGAKSPGIGVFSKNGTVFYHGSVQVKFYRCTGFLNVIVRIMEYMEQNDI